MTDTIALPIWLIIVGAALAGWVILDRLLVPSVRWFFRRRANIVIDELNKRLDLELPAFKLAERHALIDRLTYDQKVLDAVENYCKETGAPREVAIKKVQRYAREIVPNFSAFLYFSFGSWLAKRFIRTLFRVRLGYAAGDGLANVDPRSSVVFVMNHRSNMDYILVAYLALNRVALSYAVGEWARVWPIQQLISALGAYFVRRGSGNELYRRVLERYVQMAVDGGVVQAVFPEGGLSRDGKLRPPKLGLIDYMLRGFNAAGQRDILFLPVGINYDRVLEDRTLLLDQSKEDAPKTGFAVVKTTAGFILKNIVLAFRARWYRFGYACANFGNPISLRAYLKQKGISLTGLTKEERIKVAQDLADHLMAAVGDVIPVLPVSLVAHVMLKNSGNAVSALQIKAEVHKIIEQLDECGALIYIPRSDWEYAVDVGLRMLTLRRIIMESEGLYHSNPEEEKVLRYYRNSIIHLINKTNVDSKAC